MYNIGG